VLSEHLAPRCAHVHVVELDRALVPALEDALAPFDNTTLHVADAMALDLGALDPAPTGVVANMPYGIAAGAILRTIEDLDGVTRWVAMVQRAAPASGAYGVPSVLAQLACDVRVHRAISRTVFHPVPNVDSVLVVLERRGPAPPPELRALVQAAFAHRRKALARSLALSPAFGPGVRDRAREALVALGHPADARAERLSPADFRALWEALR
jgi:16S rRNA (adenine1518-N6/adenine1519-N6)-dimethyltransferase